MTLTQDFAPRWASSPGATIVDLIEEKNTTRADVATACNLDSREFDRLLQGLLPTTEALAEALSAHLGGTASFWLRREARFREMKAWTDADEWAQSLPLRSMKKLSWIEIPRDWRERIMSCLEFFDLDSIDAWHRVYSDQLFSVKFRTSETYVNQIPSVSAWLRAGEIAQQKISVGTFNPDALQLSLDKIRRLTKIPDPEKFIPDLHSIAAECGVCILVVPTPEGCAASGASRVLADGSALIQLSGRFLSDDQFWFSLFHEIGHLLMHQESSIHIDGDSVAFESSHLESEANAFAGDVPWPYEERQSIVQNGRPSRRDIIRLANSIETSPGIVVGRLQKSSVLDFTEYNNLKRRYRRDGTRLMLKK